MMAGTVKGKEEMNETKLRLQRVSRTPIGGHPGSEVGEEGPRRSA